MSATKKELDFGAWEPDAAKLAGTQACEAKNVLPCKRGYLPMPGLVTLSFGALPQKPLAVWTNRNNRLDESVLCVVATTSGIWSLESGTWVRRYTGTSSVNTNRCFAEYGTTLYCLWGTTLLKSAIGGTMGDFEEVADTSESSVPRGNTLAVVQDFLCMGRMSDAENQIHWSGIDNPEFWPPAGSTKAVNVQSDIQTFPVGGKVQAIVGGFGTSVTGIVFLDHAVQLMTYVGSPYIFQFSYIDRFRGLLAPKSPILAGDACYYLSEDGWMATDGSSSKNIGSGRVNSWFFDRIDSSRMDEVMGVLDVERKLCWWAFPSSSAKTNVLDTVLVYDFGNDRWSWGNVSIEYLMADTVRGITLDQLDTYGDLDHLPFASLDSAALKSGRGVLAAFSTGHKLSTINGDALEATITTSEIGGDRMMVHGLRPLVDCGAAKAMPVYRTRQMDHQKYGKYTGQSRDGVCYQHVSTVYLSGQVSIPAKESWTHAVGVEALVEIEGGM